MPRRLSFLAGVKYLGYKGRLKDIYSIPESSARGPVTGSLETTPGVTTKDPAHLSISLPYRSQRESPRVEMSLSIEAK